MSVDAPLFANSTEPVGDTCRIWGKTFLVEGGSNKRILPNQKMTCFYYLAGKQTPLKIIGSSDNDGNYEFKFPSDTKKVGCSAIWAYRFYLAKDYDVEKTKEIKSDWEFDKLYRNVN